MRDNLYLKNISFIKKRRRKKIPNFGSVPPAKPDTIQKIRKTRKSSRITRTIAEVKIR